MPPKSAPKVMLSVDDITATVNTALFEIEIDTIFFENVQPSMLNVAMMTLVIATGKKIDIRAFDEEFVTALKAASERIEVISVSGVDGEKASRFPNAQIVRLRLDGVKKYCVFFENGAVQVMGCKAVLDIVFIVTVVYGALGIEYEQDVREKNIDIRLITSNFKFVDCTFYLQALHAEVLKEYPNAWFDTNRSPGVQVPIVVDGKKVSVVLFSNGNVVITGANGFAQITEVWKGICGFMNKHLSLFKVEIGAIPAKKAHDGEDIKRGRKRPLVFDDLIASLG